MYVSLTSVVPGGSDTVGTVGARTGGVSHYALAASDGSTLLAVVSAVEWTALGAWEPASLSYSSKEFVVKRTVEESKSYLATDVGSGSGEGIGVATSPLSSDSVSVSHED